MQPFEQPGDELARKHEEEVQQDRQCDRPRRDGKAEFERRGDHNRNHARSRDQRRGQRDDAQFVEIVPHGALLLLEKLAFADRLPADEEHHDSAGDLQRAGIDPEHLRQNAPPRQRETRQHQERGGGGFPRQLQHLPEIQFRPITGQEENLADRIDDRQEIERVVKGVHSVRTIHSWVSNARISGSSFAASSTRRSSISRR
ncbi:hypothetical protein SDC9_172231 [bioreactor metagenome]|uniref:Uncharacterized protein n=1 Tax=bioreactor metagenome TaxID=1076179 RepID=A0A645GF98_9ZZZZ